MGFWKDKWEQHKKKKSSWIFAILFVFAIVHVVAYIVLGIVDLRNVYNLISYFFTPYFFIWNLFFLVVLAITFVLYFSLKKDSFVKDSLYLINLGLAWMQGAILALTMGEGISRIIYKIVLGPVILVLFVALMFLQELEASIPFQLLNPRLPSGLFPRPNLFGSLILWILFIGASFIVGFIVYKIRTSKKFPWKAKSEKKKS